MRERGNRRSAGPVVGLMAGLLLAGGGLPQAATNAGEEAVPYVLEVQDAAAKVGEPATLTVRLRLREGYRFLDAYRNRAVELSTQDGSVTFGQRVVRGRIEGDTLVIEIPVTPEKPGPHVINGVLRIGYAEGRKSMYMVSVPLIAKVVGGS
jgi:hypothetical protein